MKKIFNLRMLFALTLLVFLSTIGYSQKAILKGTVLDSAKTGEDMILWGANVRVFDANDELVGGGSADFAGGVEGGYEIMLNPGDYVVKYSYTGRDGKNVNISLKAGETKELNIDLPEGTMLDVVVVSGNKAGTSVGKSTVSIDVLGGGLIENSAATKVDDAVGKVPGVSVVDGQANIRGGSGYSYGAGSRVLILVDDMPFMQADAGLPNWRDIPVENIDNIEVLKGAASALYGSSALNGIINIRTAYAKKKPVTKFSLFQTSYGTPRRAETAWWKRDSLQARIGSSDTIITPQFMKGPIGYRTPIELGFSGAHRRKIGKFDLTLGGNLFWKDSPRGGEYERKVRFNTNMRYRITDSLNIGLNFNFNHGQSSSFFIWGNQNFFANDSTNMYMPYPGTITQSVITRFAVDPFASIYDKRGNRHRIQARMFYVNNVNRAQSGQGQSNQSVLNYLEYQNQSTFRKLDNLRMVFGVVGQYTYVTAELYGNAKYHLGNAAAYLQMDKGFFKKKDTEDQYKLMLSFGARYEHFIIDSPDSVVTRGDGTVELNPEPFSQEGKPVFRFGLNYEPVDFTFIRMSWGQGYRYPTVAERYIVTAIDILEIRPNPELRSETGWSFELGIKQGFKLGNNWKGFVDGAFFWTEYKDMMEFTFGGGDSSLVEQQTLDLNNLFFQSANVGDTRILGTEWGIMGQGTFGDPKKMSAVKINILAGYTYIDPRFKDFDTLTQILSTIDQNLLKYRSRHMAKLDIEGFFLKESLSFGVAFQYNSAMQNIDKVFESLVPASPFPIDVFGIGAYRANHNKSEAFNLSARIGYRFSVKDEKENEKLGLKLSLVGNNLLNQEYTVRPGLMAPPMHFTARLDVEF